MGGRRWRLRRRQRRHPEEGARQEAGLRALVRKVEPPEGGQGRRDCEKVVSRWQRIEVVVGRVPRGGRGSRGSAWGGGGRVGGLCRLVPACGYAVNVRVGAPYCAG